MSEQGVPASLLVGEDHIQVKAALVKYLRGGNAAIVFHRIRYRTQHVAYAYAHDDLQWWMVTEKDLGDEVGLTESQVNTAIANLLKRGAIRREAHSYPLQTWSYAVVISQSGDSGIGAEGVPKSPDSKAEISGLQGGDLRIPPSTEEREEEKNTPVVPAPDPVAEGFERVFKSWPAARRVRKTATASWAKAVATVGDGNLDRLIRAGVAFGERYSTWAPTEQSFVPHLTTWLNQERWTTPLPEAARGAKRTTVDHGREVDAELRRRAAVREQQLALGAS